MSASEAVEAANAVEVEHERRMTELQRVFAAADPKGMKLREVPDYLVDKISFGIMHDPVMTRSGHSYERATIVEYLRRADVDPLTREPLSVRDLRPNLQLRDACEAFLEENGWAVDY